MYAALKYDTSYNLGDNIQTLAAIQYLPKIDLFIDRDLIENIDTDNSYKIIYNGWFNNNYCANFPLPHNIKPIIISFHLSNDIHDILKEYKTSNNLLTYKSYLDNSGSIGCRDFYTLEMCKKENIPSYFSGCLTLTLNKKDYWTNNTNNILIVDVPIIKTLTNATYISQSITDKKLVKNNIKKLELARKQLEMIANSRLVITSRLHTFLPAIAFKIPVIFYIKNINDPRFKGLVFSLDGKPYCPLIFNDLKIPDISNFKWENMPLNISELLTLRNHLKLIVQQKLFSTE